MLTLEKYSFGIGDRFGLQGKAQLKALMMAGDAGIPVVPVWNKSNREHQIIHSNPSDTRIEAEMAVQEMGWRENYYIDADHINMQNVGHFLMHCNFFTIDVADYIAKDAGQAEIDAFVKENLRYTGELIIRGIDMSFNLSREKLRSIGSKFLRSIGEASRIYNHIAAIKGTGNFIAEISMDEVDEPQSPVELFFILSMISKAGIPAQTIAPKFTGRFNKGVDYSGDVDAFAAEFEQDLLVIDMAINEFELPGNLKLSVHSGSDKFSIYPVMGTLIKKYDKGIHVKTAGTTWLEEMTGLAMAGGEALDLARSIYIKAYQRREELCRPYATVIDILESQLPDPEEVKNWDSMKFASSLRHIPGHPDYNPGFRQLIHVGYKVAAEYGQVYLDTVRAHCGIIGQQVTENIYERHLKRLFDIKY